MERNLLATFGVGTRAVRGFTIIFAAIIREASPRSS
jgi:hypothetical protein